MGRVIVIEGSDGSGKETQTRLLFEYLQAQGRPVRRVTYPNYESESSALVRMYLGREFGRRRVRGEPVRDLRVLRCGPVRVLSEGVEGVL